MNNKLKYKKLCDAQGNVLAVISDQKINNEADIIAAYDYFPFGMQMPARTLQSEGYRYGFGGHEKDDEVKGNGNHLAFGDYGYDTRLGRRWNIDPVFNVTRSNYSAFGDNPIIFVDPAGNTEFYYKGKWIGTDGQNNNLIGIVKSKTLNENILSNTKIGQNYTTSDVAHGTNNNNMLIIHNDVLTEANNVLNRDINDPKMREHASVMSQNESGGFDVTTRAIGGEIDLVAGKVATVQIPTGGDVSIHSHITKLALDAATNEIKYSNADAPGPNDPAVFAERDMNIIVGKSGIPDSDISSDSRPNVINVFTGSTANNPVQIKHKDANTMINGDRGRNGKKFEKKQRQNNSVGTNP